MNEARLLAAILTVAYNVNTAKDGPQRVGTLEQRVLDDYARFLREIEQRHPDLKPKI